MTLTGFYRRVLMPSISAWLGATIFVAWSPDSLWGFRPSEVVFLSAPAGGVPPVAFSREIRWPSFVSYQVTVRTVSDPTDNRHGGGGQEGALVSDFIDVACEDRSLPFTYRVSIGPLVGKDLSWWAPGDDRCARLPNGPYWVETVWTLEDPIGDFVRARVWADFPVRPLGPLTPTRTIIKNSNVFWIGEQPEGAAFSPAPPT